MKYKPKIYAEALMNSILDKKTEGKKIIDNFLKLLEKNQDLKKAKEIITLIEAMLLKKTGNKKVTIETARKNDTKDFIKKLAKKGDLVQEKTNLQLIAGLKVIINNDKQLDLSLQRKLQEIFK